MRKTLLAAAALAALSIGTVTAAQADYYDGRTYNNGYHDSYYRDHHHYRGVRYGDGDSWRRHDWRHHYYRHDDRYRHD